MTTDQRIKALIDECPSPHDAFRLGYALALLTVADGVETWMHPRDVRRYAEAASEWRERCAADGLGYVSPFEVAKAVNMR
jgi:hypothetical protein